MEKKTDELPDDLMRQAKTLREQADDIEAQAIQMALGLTAGNVRQASILLGVSTGFLSQAVRPGRRHYQLRHLLNHRKGRPPERPERVAKEAARLPKELAQLMPKTKGKANGKPKAKKAKAPKQAPKAPKVETTTMTKRTDAEWTELIDRWLAAKATGASQKEFAKANGVGISTLRERTSALLAAREGRKSADDAAVQVAVADDFEPSDLGAN